MLSLRDYQVLAFAAARSEMQKLVAAKVENPAGILRGDCGSGKTVLAAHLIDMARKKGTHCLFLCRREELIEQASDKLDKLSLFHGIIVPKSRRANTAPIQIASAQTLINMIRKAGTSYAPWIPEAGLIIIDEADEAVCPTIMEILAHYPKAVIFGLTATPARTDGRGLGRKAGGIFDFIVNSGETSELIDEGYLCPFVAYEAPEHFDFGSVKVKGHEFDDKQLSAIIDKPKVVGSVYNNWKRYADGRDTIVFAVNCLHGQHIVEEFKSHGEDFEYIDAETPKHQRRELVAAFRAKEIMGVVNVGLFTKGFDVPHVSCVSMARPTMSLILYRQMVGRGMRPYPGKDYAIFLDHGDNIARFGPPDLKIRWSLDGIRKTKGGPKIQSVRTCPPPCGAMLAALTRICPVCGFVFVGSTELPKTDEVTVLVARDAEKPLSKAAQRRAELEEQVRTLSDLVAVQTVRGHRPMYAITKFHEKYGKWPAERHGVKKEWETKYELIHRRGQPSTWGWQSHIAWWEFGGVRYERAAVAPEPMDHDYAATTGRAVPA